MKKKTSFMFRNGVILWSILGLIWIIATIISKPESREVGVFIIIVWYLLTPVIGWINELTDWI